MCSFAELLQHKNLSQRLRSLRLAPNIGELLSLFFLGGLVAFQNVSKANMYFTKPAKPLCAHIGA